MGSILHTRVVSTTSGLDRGELVVESAWITGKNQRVLNEQTSYVFERHANSRTIDMSVTLKALDRVVFIDDKEGLLGMRVARWLESPDEKGGVFTDANGNATKVDAAADANSGPNPATGVYLTSEGAKGGAAWGTRGRWCALTGHTGSHTVTIAIFDHPRNPGYPTYWHARGYGLFAANPLGRNIFDPKQPSFNYTLEKDQSVTFSYRIDLLSGAAVSSDLDRESSAFAAKSR